MGLLTEDISEYVKDINTMDDLINRHGSKYLYHRTSADIKNVHDTGMSREFQSAQAYGYGLYTSLRLEDCINNRGYGNKIIKIWVPGFERCLIDRGCNVHGHDLAELIHGQNASVKDQIKKLFKPEFAVKLSHINSVRGSVLTSFDIEPTLQENDIDGVIYDWGGGHWVCVWKDYKKAFPMAVSLDDGRTFKLLGDETTIKNVLNTWEPNRVLGTDISKYQNAEMARVQNGYLVLPRKSDGKYNYFDPKQGKHPLASVWFDIASPVDENGVGTVKFNGQKFWYYAPEDEIYEIDGTDTEEALMMNDPIGHSADLPKITSGANLEENNGIFGKLLTETLDEYVPNVDRDTLDNRNNDLTYFYRLSKPHQLKSIEANGFTKEFRGSGSDNTDWVGSGTYGVVYPSNRVSSSYGGILWKYATPTELVKNTYISPDPHLARKFGIQGSFGEQLERFFPDLCPKWKANGMWRNIIAPAYSGSAMIRKFNDIAFHGSGGKSDYAYHSHGINGIIYHGNIDGESVITFDDSTIIPIAWKDNTKPHDDWHPIDISDDLWNRTYNGFDPLPFLKGTYRDYSDNPNDITQNYRVVNGYMLVCRKDNHKYNYVKAPEGGRNFASSVWFDLASPIDENGMGTIKFNGQKFWYYAPEDEIYEIDGTDTEEALMMNDPIGYSADLPKIASNVNLEENKTVFGELLEEILKK